MDLETERPQVAGLFINRLRAGMKLQTDPTIIYGIEGYDGDIRFKDIKKAHPYNTYTIKGLPPGPIALLYVVKSWEEAVTDPAMELTREDFERIEADLLDMPDMAQTLAVVALFAERQIARDDEVIVLVGVGLRPLRRIDDVLERERMDLEDLAEALQQHFVAEALHVEPDHLAGRERELEDDIERRMNKTALVTLWVDPAEHQIVKYTFDNVWLDFLPGAWLVRIDDLRASMTMGQPFPGVWLPRDMAIHAGLTLAAGGAGDEDGELDHPRHGRQLARGLGVADPVAAALEGVGGQVDQPAAVADTAPRDVATGDRVLGERRQQRRRFRPVLAQHRRGDRPCERIAQRSEPLFRAAAVRLAPLVRGSLRFRAASLRRTRAWWIWPRPAARTSPERTYGHRSSPGIPQDGVVASWEYEWLLASAAPGVDLDVLRGTRTPESDSAPVGAHLADELAKVFLERTAAEWEAILNAGGVPAMQVLSSRIRLGSVRAARRRSRNKRLAGDTLACRSVDSTLDTSGGAQR